MSLWNVSENSQHGSFSENHDLKNGSTNDVFECEMLGAKCTTIIAEGKHSYDLEYQLATEAP
jgi:hypothetical protein